MPSLIDLAYAGSIVDHSRPWGRSIVDASAWEFAIDQLAEERWVLSALWAESTCIHMGLYEEQSGNFNVFSIECHGGIYPAISQCHAPASRLERAIHDLWGHKAVNAADSRPWLDHGVWERRPLENGAANPDARNYEYSFLPVEGENLHQVAVGPVHAGTIEPGHFRFTASGETVVRLEERLGYTHKGVASLMAGADLSQGLMIAERISGDSTAAYALAYSRAAEAALEIKAPPRAAWLRALIVELERIANHLGDFGAICNDAAFAMLHAHCALLREHMLRTAAACFGHRLMRDVIAPGGVLRDLAPHHREDIIELVQLIERRLPRLIGLYDETSSLQDRTVGTGRVAAALVRRFGAGGFVGRASGRAFDARKAFAFEPYDGLAFETPSIHQEDVDARVRVRIFEIQQSLSLVRQIIEGMPNGEVRVDMPVRKESGEGMAMVEGFRGDIFAWVRISEDGRIDQCHLRDPSWFQWPLLEAAIDGNIIADFPLCNKSFNCSYSGHDL